MEWLLVVGVLCAFGLGWVGAFVFVFCGSGLVGPWCSCFGLVGVGCRFGFYAFSWVFRSAEGLV